MSSCAESSQQEEVSCTLSMKAHHLPAADANLQVAGVMRCLLPQDCVGFLLACYIPEAECLRCRAVWQHVAFLVQEQCRALYIIPLRQRACLLHWGRCTESALLLPSSALCRRTAPETACACVTILDPARWVGCSRTYLLLLACCVCSTGRMNAFCCGLLVRAALREFCRGRHSHVSVVI